MATLYTPPEIAAIGRAGSLCAAVLNEAAAAAVAGAGGPAIDALVRARFAAAGADAILQEQSGPRSAFPAAISISSGRTVANGTLADQPLSAGALARLDLAVRLDGWVCDAATTVAVGGVGAGEAAQRVMAGGRAVLRAVVGAMGPGVRWPDVVAAGQAAAEEAGVWIAQWPWGHGVGRRLHEPPVLPGDPQAPGADFELRPGMALAVEPIVLGAPARLAVAADGWSIEPEGQSVLAACEERTVAVTRRGIRMLTPVD